MIATLAKKAEALEAAFWAKAERITSPTEQAFFDYYLFVWPLGSVIHDRWLRRDPEAKSMRERMARLEGGNLSIHPAFLKDEPEPIRRGQWLTYHRQDYRELNTRYLERFMADVASLYDVQEEGLQRIALRLFEEEFDRFAAEHEYIGVPTNREEMACNHIELLRISELKSHKAGYPEDKEKRNRLWRQATIEYIDYCYGRHMTDEELSLDWKMWEQVREDIASGKPASESEAARYIRDLFERYPRKSGLRTYLPGEADL